MKTTPSDGLMTEKEAAALLNIRPSTLTVWRCTKRYALPWVRVGRAIRYNRDDVIRFIASRTETPVEA